MPERPAAGSSAAGAPRDLAGAGLPAALGLAPQHDLLPPAEHRGAALGQQQRAVVAFDGEKSLRQQLAHDGPPFGVAKLGTDAEDRERVMAQLGHSGRLLAEQDVDDVAGAKLLVPLTGA